MDEKQNIEGIVSKHAEKRHAKRAGNNASEKMFKRALERGIYVYHTSGKLNNYMQNKLDTDIGLVIYGEFCYLYNPDTMVLVTTYKIPTGLKAHVKSAKEKRK